MSNDTIAREREDFVSIRDNVGMNSSVRVVNTVFNRWPLVVELVRRELKLRYRGTWLGFFWTLINPLVMTGVYTLVFSTFLRINIPKFPAFLLCGLFPWMMWFAEAITMGTNCLVDHAGFLKNAVFPAEILPVVAVGTGMMNYTFSLPVLIALLLVFGVPVRLNVCALPVVMAVQFLFALGIVYFTATYNVFFRDLRYIVQHILMAASFLTPIMYDFSVVPVQFQWLLKLNPMTTVISAYRNIFFYGAWPNWRNLGLVAALSVVLLVFSAWVFERNREIFAEYL
ncbi:MAG: ABC transporter permease [Candidatus Caldatribacterium sp.]|nr:ABC transporter permease [Candidatus Caldatribacterium sp.]